MTLSLLPGSSGSAARDLPGLYSMKAEIGKRKLDLLSRIINSSTCLAYRKLFARRLIKWKRRNKQFVEFIPDVIIIKVMEEFDLRDYITFFSLRMNAFLPNKDGNQLPEMLLTKRNICNGSIRSVGNLAWNST